MASGSIVSMSLIYGIKWPGSLFGADGVSGLANIEITPEFAMKLGQALGSVLAARAKCDDEPRRAPCLAPDESMRHYGLAFSRRKRARPARDADAGFTLCSEDVRRCRRAYRYLAVLFDQFLLEFFDSHGVNLDKNTERKDREHLLPRGFPAHADGVGRTARFSRARRRGL